MGNLRPRGFEWARVVCLWALIAAGAHCTKGSLLDKVEVLRLGVYSILTPRVRREAVAARNSSLFGT